ncbi:MAG: ABC transporter permease [Gaiellales bacterium]
MTLFLRRLRWEQLLFWRNRESAVFVFIFPPLLYLLLGAIYSEEIDDLPAADVLLAGLVGYGCANTAFAGLAITQVIRRENGSLKRLRSTPLPMATYFSATVVSTLLVFALQMLTTLALGLVLYGAHIPKRPLEVAVLVVFGGLAFAGLGFGAAAVIRSAEGASAVVNLAVLPMAFLSGSFGPTRNFPEVLTKLSELLPLTYFVRLLGRAYLLDLSIFGDLKSLGVVAAWGLAGYVLAWRKFSWSPRER